jgi:hypothetical protein
MIPERLAAKVTLEESLAGYPTLEREDSGAWPGCAARRGQRPPLRAAAGVNVFPLLDQFRPRRRVGRRH